MLEGPVHSQDCARDCHEDPVSQLLPQVVTHNFTAVALQHQYMTAVPLLSLTLS